MEQQKIFEMCQCELVKLVPYVGPKKKKKKQYADNVKMDDERNISTILCSGDK